MRLRFIRKAQSVNGNRGKALVFAAEASEQFPATYCPPVTWVLEAGGES